MNINYLIKRNRTYFARYYRLVTLAVIITTAVITGSLLIGDSVRSTLANRVYERLGSTETVVFSMQSFMDGNIIHHPVFEGHTRELLVTNGFVSHAGRLIPVMVWGVDDMSVPAGKARINQRLAKEMNLSRPQLSTLHSPLSTLPSDIVLRLPATGMVPSGSLFVADNYTTSMRLTFDGIVDVKQQGNLSLKNEQTLPLNIFVNRDELAATIETEGKINLLLSSRIITPEEFDEAWHPALSGLQTVLQDGVMEITSDRVFIQQEVVQSICAHNPRTNRLFSYLVNSIEYADRAIPYSFVTAMDKYKGYAIQPDEIILSDYTAQRLKVNVNDTLRLTFFTSADLKTLRTDTLHLCVSRIVPLQELTVDTTLSANFPGLSNVERCTDWDSDLPIDMKLITGEDEAYWNSYRSTPKAIIPYQAIAATWSNSFGSATALRIESPPVSFEEIEEGTKTPLGLRQADTTIHISPFGEAGGGLWSMFGIQLTHPREPAFQAARNGVDFSSLFLSLGFFIIVSAMLLMLVPLSEMMFRRKDETTLLQALGYTTRRIIRLYRQESLVTVIQSSVAGVIVGLIYTWLVLLLLGTVWKGATHTEGFKLYPNIQAIAIGLLTGLLLSVCLLRFALRRYIITNVRKQKRKSHSLRRKFIAAFVVSLMVVLLAFINPVYFKSTELFVFMGILFIGAAALWGDYLICRNGVFSDKPLTQTSPVWKTLFAGRKQAILSFFPLAMGVFIVFSVGLNRQGFADSAQLMTGTGGYSLWCESSVPVYHNLSTISGRQKLALTGLPEGAEVMQIFRYGADDASCLNLNKVSNPTVLGVDMEQLSRSKFKINRSLWSDIGENSFEHFNQCTDSLYPVLVDETVLTWSLALQLGDSIVYKGSNGKNVIFRIAGTLQNSIFQGNILIDRNLFSEIWNDITGSEVMLVKVDVTETEKVRILIAQALSDYGVTVMATNERLNMFNSVTDTYLTIFLMLGSIGLLLGIMSFIIVVRKNLASRQEEINVYCSLGFPSSTIAYFLRIENNAVPLYAIGTGIIGSMLTAGGGLTNISVSIWLTVIAFAMLFVAGVLVFIRKEIGRITNN